MEERRRGEKACENPKIKEWFDSLTGDNRKYAMKLFQKIEAFPVSDPEFKKELYRNGIMAFETLALKDSLSALDDVRTEGEFELLNKIVKDMDALEAVHYHQIVKNRMGVLKKFEQIVPTEKEKVIQEHVFDHLWLLDSSWERASTDARMEQSVTKEFEKVTASLTDEEKRARIDIRYRTAAGKHIIIELKKYSASVKNSELIEQIQKYRMALEKCLEERYGEEESIIEIVCILGSPPTPKKDDKRNREALKAHGARYTTYDTLIKHTRDSYRDWLDKEKELEGIRSLIAAL